MPKENKGITRQAANHLVNEGMKSAFPEIIFRGGVNLEDGAKYRSSEFDMFIPVEETTSSLLFGQLGFRDHDSSSFDGRTYVNVGMGYRRGQWMAARRQYVSGCRHPLFPLTWRHWREVYKDSLAFSGNYYFLSPAGKRQQRMNYMMSVRHMALICEQRHASRFSWFSGELTYEQYYGDKVDLLGNGTLSRNPRAAGAALVWNPAPCLRSEQDIGTPVTAARRQRAV